MIEMREKAIDQVKLGEDRDPIITHHRRPIQEGRGRMGTGKESPREGITIRKYRRLGQRFEDWEWE